MADTKIELIDPTAKLPAVQKKGGGFRFSLMDRDEIEQLNKSESLEKSVVNNLNAIRNGGTVTRLAFESDPTRQTYYSSLFKQKRHLVPDDMLKRIAIVDDLVGSILAIRSSHISSFGRKLEDRFSTGFRVEPHRGVMQKADTETKETLQKRIEAAEKRLASCGSDEGWDDEDKMSLSTFMHQQSRNGILFGRFATEIICTEDVHGTKKFHSFRPVDAGTIYQAIPDQEAADRKLRQQALRQLEKLKNKKLRPEGFNNDEYKWVQVINSQPRQAFTGQELVVHNLYQTTDVELGGYPLTPLDIAIAAVTTHINITSMNKLYFQNGRAARGMVIIKSADVTQDIIAQIRQHFQASINSVQNSFRVPIFGIEPEDEITWQPIDTSTRDMEFQYLSDSNARTICMVFSISPEEIPGLQHLSRGTNNRSLSESDNEYQLEAARDIGIRPLLAQFQDFLNANILPLIDKEVSECCTVKLYGLDSDSAEKESTRLAQDMPLHGTYDEIMERTEHDPLGKKWGGTFPLNPSWQAAIAPYLTAGEIREKFFGVEGAAKDPQWAYVRDQFWMSWAQMQMQTQQAQQQAQQQQQMAASGQQGPPQGDQDPNQPTDDQEQPQGDSEIANGADQVMQALGKSELTLPPNRRRLVAQHKKIVDSLMDEWERDSKQALREIVGSVKRK